MPAVPVKQYLLAPRGLAEPDDLQGWMEHGGLLALQRALALEPAVLRRSINDTQRRDGAGFLAVEAGQPAAVDLSLGPAPDPRRLVVEELPAWFLEGGLLLALACEQSSVTLYLPERRGEPAALLDELIPALKCLGIAGRNGWAGGVEIEVRPDPAPAGAIDPVTTRLLPVLLWERRDPGTMLLAAAGAVGSPGIYEIPLGIAVRDFLYRWAGGVQAHARLLLDDRPLAAGELAAPLTFEQFGRALGRGRLNVITEQNSNDGR